MLASENSADLRLIVSFLVVGGGGDSKATGTVFAPQIYFKQKSAADLRGG